MLRPDSAAWPLDPLDPGTVGGSGGASAAKGGVDAAPTLFPETLKPRSAPCCADTCVAARCAAMAESRCAAALAMLPPPLLEYARVSLAVASAPLPGGGGVARTDDGCDGNCEGAVLKRG